MVADQVTLHHDDQGGNTFLESRPGSECRNTKRQAALEEGDPREKPAQKKVKGEALADQQVEKPEEAGLCYCPPKLLPCRCSLRCQCSQAIKLIVLQEREDFPGRWKPGWCHHCIKPAPWMNMQPNSQDGAKVITPEHVRDDSIMRKLLPKLSETRYERRGNRLKPEPPRLVAKICEEEGRGELWLGPLPTKRGMDRILDTKPSIQIFCFTNPPDRVRVEPDGEWGMFIPGTRAFRCEMSNPQVRDEDLRALRPCLINSLRQGGNAYVHCVSGISKAPMAAAALSAMLMGISFGEAQSIIEQICSLVRSSFVRWESHMLNPWISAVLHEDVTNELAPTGYACRTYGMVHATTVVEGGTVPICSWRSWRRRFAVAGHTGLYLKRDGMTAGSIEEAANMFGGRFCIDCEILLKASLRIQVNRFFG